MKRKSGIFSPLLRSLRLRQIARHIREESSILDCGCGSGMLRRWLPRGCRYVGFDINEKVIRENQQTQAATDLFLCTDWKNLLLLQPAEFDVVVMAAFIEHVAQPEKMVERIVPYLRAGGQLIITTPSPRAVHLYSLGAALGLFSAHGVQQHQELLNQEDLVQIAQHAGLEVKTYYRFELGYNQLCILEKTQQ